MDVDDRGRTTANPKLLGERYRLGSLLGRGGSGRVYEAVDVMLGRTVAVKMFQPGGTAISRYRFAAEARMLGGLCHPGLVTVHDVSLDGDEPFLVMRLVDGPTLRDLLDRGPLTLDATARVGARLADVLAYVHGHDIVHRDIKPSNVLVDAAGDCHITDFGVARARQAAHLTVSGEFVGTAAYLAPEQITAADVGPATDIYALGLLLLECLTGHTEYTGNTIETALARLHRPPRIPDALPRAWRTLLTAMTAQDPESRPGARQCADTLTAIAEDRAPAEPQAVARPARLRPVHAGLSALAVAAVFAIAGPTTSGVPGVPTGEPRDHTPPATSTTTGPATRPVPPAPGVRPTPTAKPKGDKTSTTATPGPGNRGHGGNARVPGKGKGNNNGKG